jgi:nicotinate-nucleotide adenylyltransferase
LLQTGEGGVKKIGIFAGTFDPIHDGHIAFAHEALAQGLEKVMFLPEPRPRRKQGVHALEHRIAMVQLAVASEPRFGTIVLEQARFTAHETLPVLQARFAGYKLVLLFGDDVVAHMASWPHIDSLMDSTQLMIASRHPDTTELEATLRTLKKVRNLRFEYQIVQPQKEEVTSSKIRLNIKHAKPVRGLAPAVETYIKKHQLYSSADSAEG